MSGFRTYCRLGIAALAMSCGACSTPPPEPTVDSNEVFPGDLASVDRELSPAESQRVVNAMASTRTPADIAATRPLEQSPEGRWSDVPRAAILGAKHVEMAVVTWVVEGDGIRFKIVALNNDPGELVVKGDPMHGVSGVSATLGLFGERTGDADHLVESFNAHLRELGNIPRPMPKPQTSGGLAAGG